MTVKGVAFLAMAAFVESTAARKTRIAIINFNWFLCLVKKLSTSFTHQDKRVLSVFKMEPCATVTWTRILHIVTCCHQEV